jgi:hypothetical protein
MQPTIEQITAMLIRNHLFQGLSPEKMQIVVSNLQVLDVPADQVVCEQGQPPAAFYFVLSGRLKVTRYSKTTHQEEMLGFLDEGDFFGHDLFQENHPYQVSVDAVTDSVLLVLDMAHARDLFEQVPELIPRMRMLIESHNLQMRVPLNWVNPEEFVYYIARKHVIFLWGRLLPWLFIGGILLGLMAALLQIPHMLVLQMVIGILLVVIAAVLVWSYIDWSNDYCIVTGRRVVYQEKIVLLYDSRLETPLEQIQSMKVDTSQLGRIFHYGNLNIRSFTGTILFQGIRQPQDVVNLIQEMQKRSQSSLRQAELRQIEDVLKQRIGLVPPRPPAPPKPDAQPKGAQITRIQKFMADLFHLRYEYGDTIQYRTHWWILVRRIWFLTLLLLTVLGLMGYLLVNSVTGQLKGFPVTGGFFGLCVVLVVVFAGWLYNYIDWHNDIYIINNEQVVDINKKPLGNEEKKVAPIKNILSVEYKRLGVIGLILNFGTVYIRVGESTFTFDDVFNPSEVQRDLFHRISQRNLKERQMQGEAERQRIADWISTYHRITRPR